MPSRKSKIFGALLVLNLLLATAVFQFRKQARIQQPATDVETTVPALEPLSSAPKAKTGHNQPTPPSDQDDELAKLFDNAIAELGATETNDVRYIDAINGSTTVSGVNADHLNKVDLAALTVRKHPTPSFDDEIQSLVGDLIEDNSAETRHKPKGQAARSTTNPLKSYIAQLDKEARVRRNEVRLIKVQPGETLWKIAKRAYGDGHMYKKIFKANPHLRNPNMINAGEMLRVPI